MDYIFDWTLKRIHESLNQEPGVNAIVAPGTTAPATGLVPGSPVAAVSPTGGQHGGGTPLNTSRD